MLHLLLRSDAKFFDDLEDAPESQDHNQRSHFPETSLERGIGDETRDNDESIEAVKF